MNLDDIVKGFRRLTELDAFLWAKKPWPSDEDVTCQTLIVELSGYSEEEKGILFGQIREMGLELQLEVFAFRSGKFAMARSDLENAYSALSLCQSKERLLIESRLAEFAKAMGVSSRKLRRELRN